MLWGQGDQAIPTVLLQMRTPRGSGWGKGQVTSLPGVRKVPETGLSLYMQETFLHLGPEDKTAQQSRSYLVWLADCCSTVHRNRMEAT